MLTKNFHSEVYKNDLVYRKKSRLKKTKKIVKILRAAYGPKISSARLLDVGCAEGLISLYLSPYFKSVVGADVDKVAIKRARKIKKKNLTFKLLNSDGTFPFKDRSFDIVVANQIYEHAENPTLLMSEISRVLNPNGVCFLGAGNRLVVRDAHYPNLPFVSWMPTWLANYYVRFTKSGEYYEPRLKSIFGIRKLISDFDVDDFTLKTIKSPSRFGAEDVIRKDSLISKMPIFVLMLLYPIMPNYLLILRIKKKTV